VIKARHSAPSLLLLLLGFFPCIVHGATGEAPLIQLQQEMSQAVARVRPSVVCIKARKKLAQGQGNGFLWYESIGSGFIVDQRGFILTNYHVVQDAQNIVVTLWRSRQNTEYTAKIADTDQSLDLALLKIDFPEPPLVAAELGDSDRVKIGDWVLCVGSPFGFEHSVTLGVVSDTRRDLSINGVSYKDMIQTDAAINQGNSGGAMVDIYGRVIGVGTAIYAPDGTSTGVSFGIPINRARHFLTRITGAMITAAATAPNRAPAKEPINLNGRMPKDAIHKEFADCTQCHTISQKMVVSTRAAMPHPMVGACDQCHILVNDPVTKGPVTVSTVRPIGPLSDSDFSGLSKKVILEAGLLALMVFVVFTMLGLVGWVESSLLRFTIAFILSLAGLWMILGVMF
jgi:serine protease Do